MPSALHRWFVSATCSGTPLQRPDVRHWQRLTSCCHFWVPGDIKAALAGLPRFLTAERTILATLQRLGPTHWLPVHSRGPLAMFIVVCSTNPPKA